MCKIQIMPCTSVPWYMQQLGYEPSQSDRSRSVNTGLRSDYPFSLSVVRK